MNVAMTVNGVPLAPYFGPYDKVLQNACPVCGKRTLTVDSLDLHMGVSKLKCCSCGAWGSSWYDEFSKTPQGQWVNDPGEMAWHSLCNYVKRVADELAAD